MKGLSKEAKFALLQDTVDFMVTELKAVNDSLFISENLELRQQQIIQRESYSILENILKARAKQKKINYLEDLILVHVLKWTEKITNGMVIIDNRGGSEDIWEGIRNYYVRVKKRYQKN